MYIPYSSNAMTTLVALLKLIRCAFKLLLFSVKLCIYTVPQQHIVQQCCSSLPVYAIYNAQMKVA